MSEIVRRALADADAALNLLRSDAAVLARIEESGQRLAQTFRSGGKALAFGNGGSMCDAMHFAEELLGRFRADRPALPAVAASDPAYLTCTANDYGYEQVFARFVSGLAQSGDAVLAISTSGTSANVLQAVEAAHAKEAWVIGLTGRPSSPLADVADVAIVTPGADTARVQECHIKVIHILIEVVEADLGFSAL